MLRNFFVKLIIKRELLFRNFYNKNKLKSCCCTVHMIPRSFILHTVQTQYKKSYAMVTECCKYFNMLLKQDGAITVTSVMNKHSNMYYCNCIIQTTYWVLHVRVLQLYGASNCNKCYCNCTV